VTDETIKVVLADDTDEIRHLLRLALSTDERFAVVGEASDGAQAVELVADVRPDAIVIDLAMPVMDGLQAIPEIKRRSEKTKIVVFSAFEADQMSGEAMSRGADAYIEKGASYTVLMSTILELVPNANGIAGSA
jgi:DNA-binding NarL/FixJ family response regulator